MRCAYSWLSFVAIAAACGSATPLGDTSDDTNTGDTSTSSTTVIVTSNDGENTTVPFTTDESSDGGTSTTTDTTTGTDATTESTTSTSESSSTGADDDSSSGTGITLTGVTSETGSDCIEESGCEAGCQVEFECGAGEWGSAEECTTWCEANLVKAEAFACFCAQAWNNLSTCFGGLSCEEYAEYLEPTMFPYPCAIESDSLQFECKGQ